MYECGCRPRRRRRSSAFLIAGLWLASLSTRTVPSVDGLMSLADLRATRGGGWCDRGVVCTTHRRRPRRSQTATLVLSAVDNDDDDDVAGPLDDANCIPRRGAPGEEHPPHSRRSVATANDCADGASWRRPSRRSFLCASAAGALGATSCAGAAGAQSSSFTLAAGSDGPASAPPFSTRREYKDATLSNGLRVLLVRDSGAVRSSAALTIGGAGQFSDPETLPGLAHLMEHTVLSSRGGVGGVVGETKDKYREDFEDWIADRDGASNGFTAATKVCFHFTCPPEILPEALVRFSSLIRPDSFRAACRNEAVRRREVRRIDSELNRDSDATRAFYLLKDRANPNHPFSRGGMGSLFTLEKGPVQEGIDVGEALQTFFDERYLPENAVLVVVSPDNLRTLERLVAPFAETLSDKPKGGIDPSTPSSSLPYPDPFPATWGATFSQTVLIRNEEDAAQMDSSVGTLTLDWPLSLDYEVKESSQPADGVGTSSTIVSAPAVGFVVSQILARRGPGSLYNLLYRRGWCPKGTRGVPRISLPVDSSCFQIMRMEIGLTEAGYDNRSAVIAAVYNSINSVRSVSLPGKQPFFLSRELFNQYLTIARLHGYVFAPRPPDAVELAVDAITFGLGGPNGVGTRGHWPLVPSTDDLPGVEQMKRAVSATLAVMCDPAKTFATVTASRRAIFQPRGKGIVDPPLPPLSSPAWQVEPVTGARYFVENRIDLERFLEPLVWVIEKLDKEELGPPVLNPLVPPKLRSPRPVLERNGRLYYLEGKEDMFGGGGTQTKFQTAGSSSGIWREFLTQSSADVSSGGGGGDVYSGWKGRALASIVGDNWKLWQAVPGSDEIGSTSLPLPMISPEPSCRCSFVVQLLSNRPLVANVRQAARSQLWLNSFDDNIIDLAELGAPAGLAYDASFNQYGLRICFRGVSQTLPSYARRFCRRLVQHHTRLEDGTAEIVPSTVKVAIGQANRISSMSPLRRRQIVGNLRTAKTADVITEGLAFLRSCEGGVALAQGDLLPNEAVKLVGELGAIFDDVAYNRAGKMDGVILPQLQDILYRPFWKPRTSSPTFIPGVSLIADACGRVQR